MPSLCMGLGSGERVKGGVGGWQEFPPMHQTTGPVFSIHRDGYAPPLPSNSYTLETRGLLVFLFGFSSTPPEKTQVAILFNLFHFCVTVLIHTLMLKTVTCNFTHNTRAAKKGPTAIINCNNNICK